METFAITQIDTPGGPLGAVFTSLGLAYLTTAPQPLEECQVWVHKRLPGAEQVDDLGQAAELGRQFALYFEGRLKQFTVPLDLRGTPFQIEYWTELQHVPYGETRTYAEMAQRVGRPAAVRAVGAANGANPIAIIVPCHRIIGSNGHLTGYAGGLPMKRRLLELEGAI